MTIPKDSIGAREKLRAKVVAAVEAEIERVGPDAFKAATLARQFESKVASAPTLYRWISAAIPGAKAHLARKLQMAALERSERVSDPSADAAREAAKRLPAVISMADIAGAGGMVEFTAKLQECVKVAEQVMKQARNPDGSIRNLRSVLAGSEHLRRLLETAAKMRDGMRQERDLDAMMKAIVAEVARESPACAKRILHRMTGVLTLHGV